MNGYALDSNIISFRIRKHPAVCLKLAETKQQGTPVFIPPYAYYEVKRGLMFINAENRLRQLDQLCLQCPVGDTGRLVLEEAMKVYVEVRHSGWTIDEMDIFIAAWCRANDFTLVTNNTSHFAQIPGLLLEDWSV